MKIYNDQGIPIRGAASFTYKGHTICISTLEEGEPILTVTLDVTLETFTSLDDVIKRIDNIS